MLEKNGRINDAEERMVDLTMRIRVWIGVILEEEMMGE